MLPRAMARQEISEREIFEQALEIESSSERDVFLSEACSHDHTLRERVDRLLVAEAALEHFLPPTPEDSTLLLPELSVDEEAGTLIGRYKLLEKIGEGGWGVVYMAEQSEPMSRRVALKIVRLGMDSKQVIARFEVERQALAMMNHENIARVLDAGTTDTGRPYFVMELVRGIPITQYCDENKLTTPQRLELFIDVCYAVQHAHQKGIIHRDIKPSNILVTMHDHKAVPKIIDFGIAKATQQKLTNKTLFTQFQQFIGTPAYMSPEQTQMSGLDLDTRTDIYSLGVLLYELLTGKTPIDAKELSKADYDEMRRRIREEDPLLPSTQLSSMNEQEITTVSKRRHVEPTRLNRLVKGELDWIAMKAIEKDRSRRYDTATEFALDVRRYLDLEPVKAVAPSKLYQMRKMVRRHRGGFAAAAVIVISLIAGISVSSWQAVRATRAEASADIAATTARQARQVAEENAAEANRQRSLADSAVDELQQNLYASDMYVAQQFLAQDNISKVRELLDKHVPKSNQPDHRAFEWRYLWDRSRGDELYVFPGHDDSVGALSFSESGRYLASMGTDQKLKVWDVDRKDLVKELSIVSKGSFWSVRVEFGMNDRYLVAGSVFSRRRPSEVSVWDTSTWERVATISGMGFPIKFDPVNSHLIGLGRGGFLSCAFLENAEKLEPFETAIKPTKELRGYSWSPDRKLLALRENKTSVWAFESGERVWEGNAPDFRVAIASDFEFFASIPKSYVRSVSELSLQLFKPADNVPIDVEQIQPGYLHALEFSEDGKWLAAGGWDYLIHLWQPETGKKSGVLKGQLDEVFALAFSSNNQTLASGGKDGRVYLWDVRSIAPREEFEPIHYSDRNDQDKQKVERIRSRKDLRERIPPDLYTEFASENLDFFLPRSGRRRGELISANGRYLADRIDKSSVEIWDLSSSKYRATVAILDEGHRFMRGDGFGFVGSSKIIYDGADQIVLWDIEQNREVPTGVPGSLELWKGASADGNYLALLPTNDDTEITVWNLEKDAKQSVLSGLNHSPDSVVFSSDDRLVAATSSDKRCFVWDVESGAVVHELTGHKQGIASAAFSGDGKTFATSSPDGTVRLWHLESGREMLSFMPAHTRVWKLSFSTDDKLLLLNGYRSGLLLRVPGMTEIESTNLTGL
ncbi:protein kinase [bacterium]|nr:protein kinase [bacterium]